MIFRRSLLPTPDELVLAAAVGGIAGATSAGIRWLMFRYEAKRRTARLQNTLADAGKSFADAVDQAMQGLQQATSGGKVTPPDLSGSVQMRADGSFDVPGSPDLEAIFADLKRARGEGKA